MTSQGEPSGTESSPWRRRDARRPERSVGRGWSRSSRQSRETCRVPPTSRRSAAPAERGTSRRELRAGFASLTPSGTESSPWRRRDARRPEGSVGRGWSTSSRQSRETRRFPVRRAAHRRLQAAIPRVVSGAGFRVVTPSGDEGSLGNTDALGGTKAAWFAAGASPAAINRSALLLAERELDAHPDI